MTAHARLSPSGASRWVRCPGSVRLSEGLPDHSGRVAAEGTAFHHFAALCLENGHEPDRYIGETVAVPWHKPNGEEVVEQFEFDEEMARHLRPGLDRVRALMDEPGAEAFIERRVDLRWVLGEKAFGTADVIIVNPRTRRVFVIDWKYGPGIPVSPRENMQALLYALGAWRDYVPARMRLNPRQVTVTLVIEQPRNPLGGGTWSLSGQELLDWVPRFRAAAEATRRDDPPLNPGSPQCDYCPVIRHARCPAALSRTLALFDACEDMLDEPGALAAHVQDKGTGTLKLAHMVELLKAEPMIQALLDGARQVLTDKLLAGEEVPGARLVAGRRPPRRWTDEAAAAELAERYLGEEAFERRLKTLARLEKQMGRKAFSQVFAGLVAQGEPRPVLSFKPKDEDSRPDYRAVVDALDQPQE